MGKGYAQLPLPSEDRSTAQTWMEALLFCIENDGAGPTVHARNMYHISMAMYDAWAVYDDKATPCFLGNTLGNYHCPFDPNIPILSENIDSLRDIAISYAAFRVLHFRFNQTATKGRVLNLVEDLFQESGHLQHYHGIDYMSGKPEDIGNYIGEKVLEYGLQDGAMEEENYEPLAYNPVNSPLRPELPGCQALSNPDRWQPLAVKQYLHKRGGDKTLKSWNIILLNSEDIFLTPEWGSVTPFCLQKNDKDRYHRDGVDWDVYLDPGPPPSTNDAQTSSVPGSYGWNFATVAYWSSLLDPSDNVSLDISPRKFGNVSYTIDDPQAYTSLYDLKGAEKFVRKGHKRNPSTRKPYEANIVPQADYLRVIAEYWVDGINTYTPPGHWMKTLIEVSEHPEFQYKWKGKGKALTRLEWDIKAYLTLGAALHDAGIACWSVKGYYDYVRPITAIRFLAKLGQCSDSSLITYHPQGLPLIEGHIEIVNSADPLAKQHPEHIGKIKLYTWRGPEYIDNAETDVAGVGWVLAENWWPYQRYSFGTPPFAGYVSGHSTFSTCAAEVLTTITGDPFFPGGIKTFTAKKDKFLIFENGPSVDITLQWATYRDAAHETCLSRIYGGIHPPCDDLPGRWIGQEVAAKVVPFAEAYFEGDEK